MEKKIFSQKNITLENGENVILYYFITITNIKYKGMSSPVYGIEISKHCNNMFIEKEGDYGITENENEILNLIEIISKNNVMPSSLLNIIDDFIN